MKHATYEVVAVRPVSLVSMDSDPFEASRAEHRVVAAVASCPRVYPVRW